MAEQLLFNFPTPRRPLKLVQCTLIDLRGVLLQFKKSFLSFI